jgi:arylsulfatase A-like enzyme
MKRSWTGACIALLLLGITASSCRQRAELRNVLLISIDSLRADHLGAYGYPRDTSPTLDRLAAEGVRFEHALSPTSWTLPSHVTLLSGRAQHNHRTLMTGDAIDASEELLAEVFSRQGYETAGFFSGPFLDPTFGFARGFSDYISCRSQRSERLPVLKSLISSHTDETNPLILAELEAWLGRRSDRPFFAFVHMWDVHYDYVPPEPYASMFDSGYDGPLDGRNIARKGFPLDASPEDVSHLVALYDGEIRYVDDTIDRILRMLDGAGLLRNTLVVVTADHGEEFLEHDGKTHQRTLFDEVVRVPLIFSAAAGLPGEGVVATPVSLEDVAPTILSLLGLEGLDEADGRDLVPLMQRRSTDDRIIYGAFFRANFVRLKLTSLRTGPTKLVYHVGADRWSQYDVSADPGETRPLPPDEELRMALLGYTEEAKGALDDRSRSGAKRTPAELPPEVREQLEQLGYVE